jgi:TM2 domain-containing membrane protein YozV
MISLVHCAACAEQMSSEATACPKCGHPNAENRIAQLGKKSRVTAGILALLLGGIGVHKFYLNKVGFGFLYLIFFWTFVPLIIAVVEGIIYLTQDDLTFSQKQGVAV